MPKVSVLMPVYNTREEYLRPAIESILNQTFTDFEFIIINDGSTDNSPQVIQEYADKDSRIKFIDNKKNSGLIAVLNQGLDLCTGEYIARMDSDDIAYPIRFAKQLAYMEEHPECGVLGAWAQKFTTKGPGHIFTHEPRLKLLDLFIYGSHVVHPTAMIRRSVLTEHKIYYDHAYPYAEDYGMWVAIAKVSEIHNLQEILLDYRWHDNNVSVVYNKPQQDTADKIRAEILDYVMSFDSDKKVFLRAGRETNQYFKLFGIIPFARKKQYSISKTKYYLFKRLPIIKVEHNRVYLFDRIKIGDWRQ